jgi:hypothetical protein
MNSRIRRALAAPLLAASLRRIAIREGVKEYGGLDPTPTPPAVIVFDYQALGKNADDLAYPLSDYRLVCHP